MEFNRRILIVDDNRAIHEDFKKILTSEDQSAKSELEALEKSLFNDTPDTKLDKDYVIPQYEIDSAYQGQEALELVRKASKEGRPYAMAFMDMRMPPGWDGLETIENIWKEYPDLQIAICSAYTDYSWEQIIERAKPADNLLFLKKPFESVEAQQMAMTLSSKWSLAQAVRNHINNLEKLVTERTREVEVHRVQGLQNDKLAALAVMAGGVAHEINTPLATLRMLAGQVRSQLEKKGTITPELDKKFELMEKTIERISGLTHSLGDMGKNTRRSPNTRTPLSKLIYDSTQICRWRFEEKNKSLIVPEINGNTEILGDPLQAIQALSNLLTNSLDAVDGVQDGKVELKTKEDAESVTIEVSDNGHGIESATLGKIFDPFFTTRDVGRGTGLGLTVAKSLMEAMRGSISVVSPKNPTTFALRFLKAPKSVSG